MMLEGVDYSHSKFIMVSCLRFLSFGLQSNLQIEDLDFWTSVSYLFSWVINQSIYFSYDYLETHYQNL